ncbi:MAG: SWIM zinc finger family protein [Pseudonocardiaceae bacterium]
MAAIVVSEQSVRELADARSFARGRAYLDEGRVRKLAVDGTTVTAVVEGTSAYRVRLTVTRTGLDGACTCPYGSEGVFCKHCVATALAWLDGGGELGEPAQPPVPEHALREFLLAQDTAWLADELLRTAQADPLLCARLAVAAGARAHDAYEDRALRTRLERAIQIRDFVDYGAAYSYFRDVEEALTEVAELIDQGFADTAMTLAEYALELLEEAAQRVDDSDGGLRVAIDRAEGIHLDACSAGKPDPVRLAQYLVERALASGYEVFLSALPAYAPVLDSAGMARYRELVEAAWRALPPKRPHHYDSGRFTATFLMEQLAECEGGADALIEVLATDVSSSYDVLRIAGRLCQDGRDDEALDWLARGLVDFPPDSRLRTLAAECHLRAGRRAQACDLLWANFTDRPSLDTYVALHAGADDQFSAWRDRALAVLRRDPTAQSTPLLQLRPTGHSTLVEVLLWEGDAEAAWQAATAGGCRDELWLRLARERAATHPADAIPILLVAADKAIGHKNRGSYQVAAKLLVEASSLFRRCDRQEDFDSHLRTLRAAHKPKRALREELDRACLP